jgi:hypothetical protein
MVSAIGSSYTPVVHSSSVASTAGLEAQIARDEKELSACVNCASAETKQGQADIQALSNKINTAKARLAQIDAASLAEQTTATNSPTATEVRAGDEVEESNEAASNALNSSSLNAGDSSEKQHMLDLVARVGGLVNEYV